MSNLPSKFQLPQPYSCQMPWFSGLSSGVKRSQELEALRNLSHQHISNRLRLNWRNSSILLFLSPPLKIMLVQTCRPGHPGERMSLPSLCSCPSLWKPVSFNMFVLRVQNNTNGHSDIWRNFQGSICCTRQQCRPALALKGITLHIILRLHKSPWLPLTEASRWSGGGQEGHTLTLEGRPMQDVILEYLSL